MQDERPDVNDLIKYQTLLGLYLQPTFKKCILTWYTKGQCHKTANSLFQLTLHEIILIYVYNDRMMFGVQDQVGHSKDKV